MSRGRLIRALVLCTVLSFAAQAAWAGPRRPGEASGSAWAFLTQLLHAVTANWPAVGCIIAPNGACGSAQAPAPPPVADVGCILDPNGRCGG